MTTDLAIRQEPTELGLSPEAFQTSIEQAQQKAAILADIVERQHLYAVINGRKHLELEAWVTIGEAYRYTAEIEWTRQVDGGGWEARAVVRDRVGQQVGAAEAEAGTHGDEAWINRQSYAVRSMAQTRAMSKALRTRLSWVVVLAGYSPTPAEEMPRDIQAEQPAVQPDSQYFCAEHKTLWFKRGNMKHHAHPIGETGKWCNMPKNSPQVPQVVDVSQGKDITEEVFGDGAETPAAPSNHPTQPVRASSPSPTPTDALTAVVTAITEGFAALNVAQPDQLRWRQSHCPMLPDDRKRWTLEHYKSLAEALAQAVEAHGPQEPSKEGDSHAIQM